MTTERDDAQRPASLLPGERLGLALDERCAEFEALLLEPPLHGIRRTGHDWLRERYAEIVPIVLPAALRSVERGEPVDPACLARLRAVAADCAEDPRVDFSVVVRGALPAIRVFALVMHTAARDHTGSVDRATRTMLAMSRASLVAHELGSCWAEAWSEERRRGTATSAPPVDLGAIDLIARAPGLDESEERMLALAAQGRSNDEIASETSYSRQAVAWHLGRLMRTWRAPNRTALVSIAFVKGWIRARAHGTGGPLELGAGTDDDAP